ncbi:Uncharacterized protein GBIM_08366 [Gryllus bimaculatus]|nr:Uncharacterized protein GBIM_08366 [Gryllus bimaculatus]
MVIFATCRNNKALVGDFVCIRELVESILYICDSIKMGTSLIQQLQKLAAPQTSFILDEKKKASILFDPKEAASFDRETFFELGVNGLEELKKLNMRFDQFEDTLFDVSSKDLQRAVQSKEVNEKLNREISKFLGYLSPYFLLKCAHQALEWLIQRTVKISEQVLLVLVNKLSKVPHVSLESECCAVLSLLYLTQQETLSTISDTALINFTKSRTFITSLQKIIDGGGDIFNFTAVLIKEASKKILQHDENQEDLQNFLEELLSSITLNEDDAEKVVL